MRFLWSIILLLWVTAGILACQACDNRYGNIRQYQWNYEHISKPSVAEYPAYINRTKLLFEIHRACAECARNENRSYNDRVKQSTRACWCYTVLSGPIRTGLQHYLNGKALAPAQIQVVKSLLHRIPNVSAILVPPPQEEPDGGYVIIRVGASKGKVHREVPDAWMLSEEWALDPHAFDAAEGQYFIIGKELRYFPTLEGSDPITLPMSLVNSAFIKASPTGSTSLPAITDLTAADIDKAFKQLFVTTDTGVHRLFEVADKSDAQALLNICKDRPVATHEEVTAKLAATETWLNQRSGQQFTAVERWESLAVPDRLAFSSYLMEKSEISMDLLCGLSVLNNVTVAWYDPVNGMITLTTPDKNTRTIDPGKVLPHRPAKP